MKMYLFFIGLCCTIFLMSHRNHHQIILANGDKAQLKVFDTPDEVREFPKEKVELVTIGGATIGRATLQPGWKWSESVKPLVNTPSCEAPHFQYHIAGTLKVKMDDGTILECKLVSHFYL